MRHLCQVKEKGEGRNSAICVGIVSTASSRSGGMESASLGDFTMRLGILWWLDE